MKKLKMLIARHEIERKIEELAAEIRLDYEGKNPLLIGALKGCFVFMSDLVRAMDMPAEIDFVRLASYGRSRESSGQVRLIHGLDKPVKSRHVLVIEDIVDSGLTLRFLIDRLAAGMPSSLRVCALFDKPSRRAVEVPIDYRGFSIPDTFVVGYGLDFDEQYRYLPDLYVLEE